jgi:MraZ protein
MTSIPIKFNGRQAHVIDEKGRLILPSQFRDLLAASGVKDRVYLGCYPGTKFVSVYPNERWEELVRDWTDEKRFSNAEVMLRGQRLFFANIEQVNIDRTGRITIPLHFRERAGLKDDVVVIGVGGKMEIWNPIELAADEAESIKAWAGESLAGVGQVPGPTGEVMRLPQI